MAGANSEPEDGRSIPVVITATAATNADSHQSVSVPENGDVDGDADMPLTRSFCIGKCRWQGGAETSELTFEHRGTLFDTLLTPRERLLSVESYDDVRPDDVVICTYPKAGTHWTADIVRKVLHDGDLESVARRTTEEVAYEMTPAIQPDAEELPAGLTLASLSDLPSPRIIITHLLYDMLPRKVQDGGAKVIYVYRDPRDIAVSMWHQINTGHDDKATRIPWEEFFQKYVQGRVPYGLWARHFRSCFDVRNHPHVLVLQFEKIKEDLAGTIRLVSSFVGKALSDEAVESIAASCTVAATKAAQPDSPFVRKGIIGDWKNHFSVAQCEAFDEHMAREIAEHRLKVPFVPYLQH